MSLLCPKDMKPCIDDLCRGCGECIRTRTPMMELCPGCGQPTELGGGGINDFCTCPPDEPLDDEEFEEQVRRSKACR